MGKQHKHVRLKQPSARCNLITDACNLINAECNLITTVISDFLETVVCSTQSFVQTPTKMNKSQEDHKGKVGREKGNEGRMKGRLKWKKEESKEGTGKERYKKMGGWKEGREDNGEEVRKTGKKESGREEGMVKRELKWHIFLLVFEAEQKSWWRSTNQRAEEEVRKLSFL